MTAYKESDNLQVKVVLVYLQYLWTSFLHGPTVTGKETDEILKTFVQV